MKYINIKKFYIAFALIAWGLSACSNDEDVNTAEVKAFVNSEIYPTNQFTIDAIQTPASAILSEKIKFPIKLTYPSKADIMVNMAVDYSLVNDYNANNGTSYKTLPEGAAVYTKSIIVKSDEVISTDSVTLEGIDLSKVKEGAYLIPIKIAELISSNKGVQISTNRSVVYIKTNVIVTNVNASVLTNTGEVYDQTGWSASASTEKEDKYAVAKLIDGDKMTAWVSALKVANESVLTIDMGKSESMSAIRLTPNYAYSGTKYAIKSVEVYTSNDAQSWHKQGISATFNKTIGSVITPNYKIIQFYVPVSARYFQLKLVDNWSTDYTGVGEIDVIK